MSEELTYPPMSSQEEKLEVGVIPSAEIELIAYYLARQSLREDQPTQTEWPIFIQLTPGNKNIKSIIKSVLERYTLWGQGSMIRLTMI